MLVKHEERRPMVELLYFLEIGERLAHECASAQAALAPTKKMQHFLKGQARQEAFHATVFRTTRTWIAPRHRTYRTTLKPFETYSELIRDAIDRKDFFESILAEQIILEGLGEAILGKIEYGLQKRNAPFQRLRHILLNQEAAHHGFGDRVLERAIQDDPLVKENLKRKAQPYLDLSHAMVMGLADLFDEIDEDPCEFLRLQRQSLPQWIIETNT